MPETLCIEDPCPKCEAMFEEYRKLADEYSRVCDQLSIAYLSGRQDARQEAEKVVFQLRDCLLATPISKDSDDLKKWAERAMPVLMSVKEYLK